MLRRPDCEAIFQSASQRRVSVPTGRTPERSASGSTNPLAPCTYARFPVAMLVQRIGESIGESDATFPITPPSMSRSIFGINPPSSSGWITCQSAASQPTSKTRRSSDTVIGKLRQRKSPRESRFARALKDCFGGAPKPTRRGGRYPVTSFRQSCFAAYKRCKTRVSESMFTRLRHSFVIRHSSLIHGILFAESRRQHYRHA